MRLNRSGDVARDHRGAAVAAWLNESAVLFQQPVDPANTDGEWEVAIRIGGSGRGVKLADRGANALAAAQGQWMRRFDGMTPKLNGSREWLPSNGFVGDMDPITGRAAVLDAEAIVMTAYDADGTVCGGVPRPDAFGEVRFLDGLLAWVKFPGPTIQVYDTWTWSRVMVHTVPVPHYTPVAARDASGRVWVAYQTDALGLVLHPADDASRGYQCGDAQSVYSPDLRISEGRFLLAWCADEGQFDVHRRLGVLGADMESLASVPTPTPPPPPVPVPPAPVPPPAPPVPPLVPPIPVPPVEVPVTDLQIATVFAGAFFEDVSKLLKLTGSVADRRERVLSWTRAKVRVIDAAYLEIFRRPCDLEGYGSRLLLYVRHGWTDDRLKKALQDAYNMGDR